MVSGVNFITSKIQLAPTPLKGIKDILGRDRLSARVVGIGDGVADGFF